VDTLPASTQANSMLTRDDT